MEQLLRNIIIAASRTEHLGNYVLSKFGITSAGLKIITLIIENKNITLSEIAQRSGSTLPNISQRINSLEKRKIITRNQTPQTDRRVTTLSVTSLGKKIHKDAWKIIEETELQFLNTLTKKDIVVFNSLLNKYINSVTEHNKKIKSKKII
jgi:DNA-binding MarR family transcriptional regulator